MGTKIDMVSIAGSQINLREEGSIDQTSRAAGCCLKKAGLDGSQLGLLVNTGIYRDEHIVEPAVASYILRKIKTGLTEGDSDGTFSFDVNNGGCGLITGIQLVDGFIQSGGIRHGMVVTGDAEPYPGLSNSYRFTAAAAAILLSATDDKSGFLSFRTDTYQQYKDLFESYVSWISWKSRKSRKSRKRKKNILSVRRKENYVDLCVECATQSYIDFLNGAGLAPSDIDLIIPSQCPGEFVSGMRMQLDLGDRIVDVKAENGELHTAGPAFALKKAWGDGRFKQARNVLFLTVGSGITTALALYRNDLNQ
ncbi:MAG: hypothetical protein KAR40_08720 [Candidatus Sabulitectum sp.]|nr:hypothetical protein [Candidatus Sabulitectum sp.]